MTDLSVIVPEKDTVEVLLRHPKTGEILTNDDGSEMSITLHAPHTKAYRAAGFNKAQSYVKANKVKDGQVLDLSYEEMEDANIDLYASVTVSWDITYEGEKPKFTKKKAKEVYDKIFWIKGQIEEALSNEVAFTNF